MIVSGLLYLIGGAFVALLLVAPWGMQHTYLYAFGGVSLIAVIGGLVGTVGAAGQDLPRHRKTR